MAQVACYLIASIAVAALQPSSARVGRPAVALAVPRTTRRLALLMGVIAGAPLGLLIPGGPRLQPAGERSKMFRGSGNG
jgi:hypothetical protein